MLTALTIAGIAGLILGVYGRAAAIAVVSILMLFVSLIVSISNGWHIGQSIIMTFGLLSVIQFGFMVGAYASTQRAALKRTLQALQMSVCQKSGIATSDIAE